jgi:mono/diheme cytochrome c family protein
MVRQLLLLAAWAWHAQAAGLIARFEQNGREDAMVLPNAALFVSAGQAPTRFLQPGAFGARLEGWVSVDLRAQYAFQMEISGEAELFVNGAPVLRHEGAGVSELSKPVRLNKGTNSLVLKFERKGEGDAQVRLFWKARSVALAVPIPTAALSHDSEDGRLVRQTQLRAGADAYRAYRCSACHEGTVEAVDSPALTAAGGRLNADWMAEWIADPTRHRPGAHMPRMVSREEAGAIANYLASFGTPKGGLEAGNARSGEKVFSDLQCAKCHGDEAGQVSLRQVRQKFQPGALREYLLDPQAHYAWNPMPNFHLSAAERADLAAFLGEDEAPKRAAAEVERGRELFEHLGCMSCHPGPGQNRFAAKPIVRRDAGCLDAGSKSTPRFSFSAETREALAVFLEHGAGRPAPPMEFALRETAALRCAECHNASDGVIRLEALGGKLRPEWMAQFLAGRVPEKPRPWLAARMPAFHAFGKLAEGLAAVHGLPAVEPELAQAGAKLVSAAGGFSCVACHAVGASEGAVVVESPGVNLAYSGERLLPDFFQRWLMNPLALDPATKMPVYFDEAGRSQLLEVFEGDGTRQIQAIWEYVRLGKRMPPPPQP